MDVVVARISAMEVHVDTRRHVTLALRLAGIQVSSNLNKNVADGGYATHTVAQASRCFLVLKFPQSLCRQFDSNKGSQP